MVPVPASGYFLVEFLGVVVVVDPQVPPYVTDKLVHPHEIGPVFGPLVGPPDGLLRGRTDAAKAQIHSPELGRRAVLEYEVFFP